MFKYTLAATLDEMDREGITVAECPLRSMRCLSLQNGRIVGINTARFDSSAEVRTALPVAIKALRANGEITQADQKVQVNSLKRWAGL